MIKIGIRKLNSALSRYVRRAEAGERVLITDRGRVVAVLAPAHAEKREPWPGYNEKVAAGLIRPALVPGPPGLGMLSVKLPKGTAKRLIDEDRDER